MPTEDDDGDFGGSGLLNQLLEGLSLPAGVLRGFYKASTRLCSALVDVPVAFLEGAAEERRAQTTARVSLVRTTADQIAEQMRVDPEYARRAVTQFGQKVLREQVNLDTIVLGAAESIRSANQSPEESQESEDTGGQSLNDDWLNTFDSEARTKSTKEMQGYFSRILAGEITRPSSYSIRSLKILGGLDQSSARAFELLCSMCSSLDHPQLTHSDSRVFSLGGNASHNCLEEFGLDFGTLNLLNEYGLIISDYNSWMDYQISISKSVPELHQGSIRLAFNHQKKFWVLIPQKGFPNRSEFKLDGVALTNSGRELKRIVEIHPSSAYTQRLRQYFLREKLLMTPYPDGGFHSVKSGRA